MGSKSPFSLEERKSEGKPLVLVVDDDPRHHKLLELLADQLGIAFHMTTSCGQAVEALSMFSFDLILMDYRMPEVDGIVCTQRIRSMSKIDRIPIIAITAHVVKGSKEECLAAGMDDFLGKPFTLEELHQKLNQWLQEKTETSHAEKKDN
jgi:CheY-like chemotaxis protein